jgi:hypothetical protein
MTGGHFVAETNAFKIQRDDGPWYAGRAAGDEILWTPDFREAYTFYNYHEALDVLQALQKAGLTVRLFGVA